MLTLKRWKEFWIQYLLGCCIFFATFIIVSIIFSSGFVYLGEDTSSLFLGIIKSQPNLVFNSFIKIIGIASLICVGLQFISSLFPYKYKFILGLVFFVSAILRMSAMYPGISENWLLIKNFDFLRDFIQGISSLSEDSKRKSILEWLPFIVLLITFVVNFLMHMSFLIKQNRIVKKARMSIHIDDLDIESRYFSIQGVSFVLFFIFGGVFLISMNSNMKLSIPQNNTKQFRPHVFIFAIDSLRYDRLFDEKFKDVMPFLKSKLPEATLFKPMLVGVPRTFPSWVEIATGKYAMSNGIRTMFPPRSSRIEKKETIFSAAKDSGYSTIFVSDFAGDIFPRYPFGATEVNAPTSNLNSMVENGILSGLSALQAVLTLPNLHRLLPSLLESPEIADPRLIGHTISGTLTKYASISKPIFLTTFFSSAHFPYASPGPWYSKFQEKNSKGQYLFKKNPDQNVLGNKDIKEISETEKKQVTALYDGGLNAIDNAIKSIYTELENKNWLTNSIILIFGDHGENLYEGDLGMGHGDGVSGEYSNVTPLVILTKGNTQPQLSQIPIKNIIRTIDIAPTIARRITVNFNVKDIDGQPLLDISEKIPNFLSSVAYMETGIWFSTGKKTPENKPRVVYPGVTGLIDIDEGMNYEFYTRPIYSQTIPSLKERAWINEHYKLIARTTLTGVKTELYLREDKSSVKNLLAKKDLSSKYSIIANEMLLQMNKYLKSHGVEIIDNGKGSFFYSENTVQ